MVSLSRGCGVREGVDLLLDVDFEGSVYQQQEKTILKVLISRGRWESIIKGRKGLSREVRPKRNLGREVRA